MITSTMKYLFGSRGGVSVPKIPPCNLVEHATLRKPGRDEGAIGRIGASSLECIATGGRRERCRGRRHQERIFDVEQMKPMRSVGKRLHLSIIQSMDMSFRVDDQHGGATEPKQVVGV